MQTKAEGVRKVPQYACLKKLVQQMRNAHINAGQIIVVLAFFGDPDNIAPMVNKLYYRDAAAQVIEDMKLLGNAQRATLTWRLGGRTCCTNFENDAAHLIDAMNVVYADFKSASEHDFISLCTDGTMYNLVGYEPD
jgi:hypothetical protein